VKLLEDQMLFKEPGKVIGLWSYDKARAYKGGMRISNKPKKHDSI
jgi:hypothetical protein